MGASRQHLQNTLAFLVEDCKKERHQFCSVNCIPGCNGLLSSCHSEPGSQWMSQSSGMEHLCQCHNVRKAKCTLVSMIQQQRTKITSWDYFLRRHLHGTWWQTFKLRQPNFPLIAHFLDHGSCWQKWQQNLWTNSEPLVQWTGKRMSPMFWSSVTPLESKQVFSIQMMECAHKWTMVHVLLL